MFVKNRKTSNILKTEIRSHFYKDVSSSKT